MKEFYYSVGFGNDQSVPICNVLISASTLWNNKKREFKLPEFKFTPKSIYIDSGGYAFFTRYDRYPFTTKEYINFIENFKSKYPMVHHVSTMDYPCEPNINRNNLQNNIDRINAGIENTLELSDVRNLVSVFQGYTIGEYNYSIDRHKDEHIITTTTAIGSICQRKNTYGLRKIILGIHDKLSQYNILTQVNIHAYGLQLKSLQDEDIRNFIYSSDSGAWKFRLKPDGTFYPKGLKDKIENYKIYKKRIDKLIKQEVRE